MTDTVNSDLCEARCGEMKAQQAEILDTVRNTHTILTGNGKMGLVGRVINLENTVENVRSGAWQVFMKLVPWAGITALAFWIGSIASGGPGL